MPKDIQRLVPHAKVSRNLVLICSSECMPTDIQRLVPHPKVSHNLLLIPSSECMPTDSQYPCTTCSG